MPKPQKIEAVKDLKERLTGADAALLAEFRGLKVEELKELRKRLSEKGAEFKVVKNTLTRIAVREAQLEDLLPMLEGSTAIAFVKGDPIDAAKGLDEISKKYPALVLKGGLFEGKILNAEQAQSLARLKPRDVLLSELAAMMLSPVRKLAILLVAPLRDLGYVLAALRDERGTEAPESPAAEPEGSVELAPETEPPAQPETAAEPEAAAEGETADEPHASTDADAAPAAEDATATPDAPSEGEEEPKASKPTGEDHTERQDDQPEEG